jgi:hypothetical protein
MQLHEVVLAFLAGQLIAAHKLAVALDLPGGRLHGCHPLQPPAASPIWRRARSAPQFAACDRLGQGDPVPTPGRRKTAAPAARSSRNPKRYLAPPANVCHSGGENPNPPIGSINSKNVALE